MFFVNRFQGSVTLNIRSCLLLLWTWLLLASSDAPSCRQVLRLHPLIFLQFAYMTQALHRLEVWVFLWWPFAITCCCWNEAPVWCWWWLKARDYQESCLACFLSLTSCGKKEAIWHLTYAWISAFLIAEERIKTSIIIIFKIESLYFLSTLYYQGGDKASLAFLKNKKKKNTSKKLILLNLHNLLQAHCKRHLNQK